MASDESAAHPGESQLGARAPFSPAKRKRLQQLFEHGSRQLAQESYDYASELFAECVKGDPGNLSYVQSYLGNLQKKYGNNKTGARLAQFKERGARGAVKKAFSRGEWDEVIQHGLTVLTVNPWDKTTLMSMAAAAEKMGDVDPQMYYLKCAWEAAPKDPDLNRAIALALTELEQFDQAIASWHRVEQARPDDEEAPRAIAHLAVQKTIRQGGYDDDDESKKLGGDRRGQPREPRVELSSKEGLKRKIDRKPEELTNYYELAQLYFNEENYAAAEEVLAKAYEASDGDPEVREKWQDAEVRRLRKQIVQTQDEQTKRQLIAEHDQKDLEIHISRCQRYPNNLSFKYELGRRYYKVKQYNEAIREFQQARNDSSRKGRCLLHLGQCFQQIKQYGLAMSHYESAIEGLPEREYDNRKEAYYLAGKMAMYLKDLDTADKHLTQLAGLDFTYKDVSTLLDKVVELREKKNDKNVT